MIGKNEGEILIWNADCLRSIKRQQTKEKKFNFFVLKKKLPEGLALLPPHLLAYEKSQIQRAETKWNKSSRDFFTFFTSGGNSVMEQIIPGPSYICKVSDPQIWKRFKTVLFCKNLNLQHPQKFWQHCSLTYIFFHNQYYLFI